MVKYFMVFIMFLSNSILGTESLKLELENYHNDLKIYLINLSHRNYLVNKQFSIGEIYDIKLDIEDMGGKKYPCMAYQDTFYFDEKNNIISLRPGEFIGILIRRKNLISDYYLTTGVYKVKVIYKNDFCEDKGVFYGQLESDWITFEVKEDESKRRR